ncbi:MAG: baseplate J/gp47 family protein, partial [Candidatus Bathyarchaeia archaeon]
FTSTDEISLKLTSGGKWEAEVPVICSVAGRQGNVLAGTVTVMPRPTPGVEYVINKGDITNGVEAESDFELRERAKHALEFAGKATISSLESAIRAIEGVRSLLIEDKPEEVTGIVKVIVDGGDPDEIMRVIDETRAAGIKVEFSTPRIVYINVSLTLTLPKEVSSTWATTEAEKLVRSYVSSLGIGDDVLYSKIIESALDVRGVLDVTDVLITAYREEEVFESEIENIVISSEERAEPRTINILFEIRE